MKGDHRPRGRRLPGGDLFAVRRVPVPRVVAPGGMSPRDQLEWVLRHVAWLREGSEP